MTKQVGDGDITRLKSAIDVWYAGLQDAGTTTPPVVTPPASSGGRVPLVGKDLVSGLGSGLPINSLWFNGATAGKAGTLLPALKAFGNSRGRKMDGVLTFASRGSWDSLAAVYPCMKEVLDAGGLVVWSMPMAPESEGSGMLAKAAKNSYSDQQQKLAGIMANLGLNSDKFCIRLNWEWNGNWYAWSATDAATFKKAYQNTVTNLRAGGLKAVTFNLCNNKGPNHVAATLEQVWPGKDYCDVVGVDQYDMWNSATTPQQWLSESTKTPALATNIQFAQAQGVQFSVDECGPVHASYGGGDNPSYYTMMLDTIVKSAKDCAWWNTYDDNGAPNTLLHSMSSNPKTAAAIKAWLAAH